LGGSQHFAHQPAEAGFVPVAEGFSPAGGCA